MPIKPSGNLSENGEMITSKDLKRLRKRLAFLILKKLHKNISNQSYRIKVCQH